MYTPRLFKYIIPVNPAVEGENKFMVVPLNGVHYFADTSNIHTQ